MPKIVLPPLTPTEIDSRDEQENRLNAGLLKCWRGNDFDEERAQKLLRAYAIEIFNTICVFYRRKIGFRSEWLPEIVNEATYRARTVYGRHRSFGLIPIQDMLKTTVTEDLRIRSTSESAWSEFHQVFPEKQIAAPQLLPPSSYAASGVDLSSSSPLLKMAMASWANPQPSSLPTASDSPSLGAELRRLLDEARLRPEDIAEEIEIEARNVYRHLAGATVPSLVNVGKYEKALTKHLGRVVKLPTPVKRHNVSKMS